MRLIFVRHGEPDYINDCLTENGVIQAKSTAERLKAESISAVYSSPMGRAVETASFTAKEHNLKINVLDFMHEIDWGDLPDNDGFSSRSDDGKNDLSLKEKLPFDGHLWTLAYKLLTENPEFVASPDWKKHHYFKDNVSMKYYEMISEKFDLFLENFGLIRKNGLYYVSERNDATIALFAHGGSGAIMFSHILSLPFPYVLVNMPYGVCSISILNFDSEPGKMCIPRLELFNDMGHIESFKAEKLHFEK